jgi:hypothetical protein
MAMLVLVAACLLLNSPVVQGQNESESGAISVNDAGLMTLQASSSDNMMEIYWKKDLPASFQCHDSIDHIHVFALSFLEQPTRQPTSATFWHMSSIRTARPP